MPTMIAPTILLSSGHNIPICGLGTSNIAPNITEEAVRTAIEIGYRHIDCSPLYQNEKKVGNGIQSQIVEGIVKREDLFITSKVWNTYHSKDMVSKCLNKTLKDLQTDYLDLYLIHWPMGFEDGEDLFPKNENEELKFNDVDYLETWQAMEKLCKEGLIRSIGLSNFNSEQLQRLVDRAEIKPVVNQVECNPHFKQKKLLQFCRSHNIVLTAYACLGSPANQWVSRSEPAVMEDPIIKQLAKKYKKTPAQICLYYQVQRGVTVIPKSTDKQRLLSNIQVFDFTLDDYEIETIDKIPDKQRAFDFGWCDEAQKHPFYPFKIPF